MTEPTFGFIINEEDTDALTPVLSDFSIGGLVLPSDDANPTMFPLNTAVSINTGDPTVLAGIGTGPAYKAITRMNAQLADLQMSAQVIFVRVATAKNPDGTENVAGTIQNICGDPAAQTGMFALLLAPQTVNLTPRLLGATGYTGMLFYAVSALSLQKPGENYTDPVVTFTPPGATATATVGNAGVQAVASASVAGGEVTGIVVASGGQDYYQAPNVTLSGGGGAGATAHAVLNASNEVDHIVVDNPGSGYTSAPNVAIGAPAGGEITGLTLTAPGNYPSGTVVTAAITDGNGGTGSGATASVTLELLANPVQAGFATIAPKLLAHYFVGGPGTTKADALALRTTISDKRAIMQDDWEIVNFDLTANAQNEYIDGAARSMGLAIRTDFQHDGYPFYAWANTPVQGALGLKRVDGFSLLDGATDGQELLAAGIGITARGDASDTSIDSSGFVAISVANCNSDTNLNFYNKTRGRDFIDLTLIKTIRQRLGKNNVSVQGVQDVLNDMTVIMGQMPSDGVIGYQIGFKASDNSTAGLRAGKFTVYDNSEEAAPICQITINRALDQPALTAELATLGATAAVVSNPG